MTAPGPRIAIVYYSARGATARLAEAARAGVADVALPEMIRIADDDIVRGRFMDEAALARVDGAAAVLFGSPTFMGGPAAQFKAFADATSERWERQAWAGKAAGGFTCGACPNGDQSHTLAYFSILAAQHGMLWCNLDLPAGYGAHGLNAMGAQMGVVAEAADGVMTRGEIETAAYLGRRIADLAIRLSR